MEAVAPSASTRRARPHSLRVGPSVLGSLDYRIQARRNASKSRGETLPSPPSDPGYHPNYPWAEVDLSKRTNDRAAHGHKLLFPLGPNLPPPEGSFIEKGSSVEPVCGGLVAEPKPRARPEASRPVHRIQDRTALHRQTAATDAVHEALLESLKLGDALVDARSPPACEASPVLIRGDAVDGELVELCADLLQGEADALREDDERDAACGRARVAPVTRGVAAGVNQPARFVIPQRRRRDACTLGELPDGEELEWSLPRFHLGKTIAKIPLDFKCA